MTGTNPSGMRAGAMISRHRGRTTPSDAGPLRHHRVSVGPWKIWTTETVGDRTGRSVVVLVHGLGLSSRYLEPTMQALAPHFRVVAPDLPGFGRSSRTATALSLPELADALVAWMDALSVGRVALLGHSLGAQIVARVAARYPDRLSCAVLVSPARDPSARWPWQQALRLIRDAPSEPPSMVALAVADYVGAGPQRVWKTLREGMATDFSDRLRAVEHPTLIVRGGSDLVVTAEWAQIVSTIIPDARLVTVDGAPHGLPYVNPGALAASVAPFVKAHGAGD